MKKRTIQKYSFLVIGIIMTAYPVTQILRPNGLMTGGITGISRILETFILTNHALSSFWEVNLFNFLYYGLAILVLGLAYLFLGKEDALKIIFMTIFFPIALFVFTYLKLPYFIIEIPVLNNNDLVIQDLLLPAIMYGVIGGIGTGFIIRSGFTSGGSDTLAKIIYKRILPFVSLGQILMVIDGIIILSSLLVFDLRIIAYAFITKFIYIKSVDMIIFGVGNKRVKMEIISQKTEEITQYIIHSIHRGVTLVDTEGGYLHVKLKQIVTVCTPKESLMIKNYIAKIDEKAFVYVVPSSTVWGGGFKNIVNDELSDE